MRKTVSKNLQSGFTLAELLVVIAIIGFLVAVVAPQFFRQIGRGQRAAAEMQIKNLESALGMYFADNYQYPESLAALVPEYIKEIPEDPWGNPYVYRRPGVGGRDFDIVSHGADGVLGTEDDITNR